jgi:hypothetical protein
MGNTSESKSILQADTCEWPYSERRRGTDRRHTKKAQFKYFLVNGRREQARREEDRAKAYFFDRYNHRIFAAITAILLLSIFDAFLTLVLIEKGSSELNPVMAYFLEHGPLPFIIAKYILTSFGVIALLFCKNVFLSPVNMYTRSLFSYVIVTFSAVILWQLFLLHMAP